MSCLGFWAFRVLLLKTEELFLQGIEVPATDFLHILMSNRRLSWLNRALDRRLHNPNLFPGPLHNRTQLIGSLGPRLQIHYNFPMRDGFLLLRPPQLELVDNEIYLFRKHALDEIQRLIVDKLNGLFLLDVMLELRTIHVFSLHSFLGLLVIMQL